MASATFQLKAVDETAQAFASVQNNLQRLKNTSNEAGRALTKNLDVKDAMRSMAMALGLSADKIANKIAEMVTGQTKEVVDLQDELVKAGEEAIAVSAALAKARNTEAQNIKALQDEQIRLSKIVGQKPTDLAGQVSAKKAEVELDRVKLELLKASNAEWDKVVAAQDEAFKLRKDRSAVDVELNRVRGIEINKESLFNDLLEKRAEFMNQIAAITGNDLDSMVERNRLQQDYIEVTKQLIPLEQERRKLAMDAGEAIAQGFEDAALSGNNLREVLKGLTQDLLRLIFRQQITQPLAGAIGNFFAGFRAEGGPVGAGNSYVVGENGPELFVPHSSGSIVPNGAVGGGGAKAASAVNVTYNIASGVSRSDLVPILEQERKRLKAEIPDMVRRGGSYRAAFA